MAEQVLKYRRLIQTLDRYGITEMKKTRGKGSHRMLVGVVEGRLVKQPIKCHKESEDKPKAVIASLRRVFKLTARDGVSDDEFYR